eukprot:CAMPEP_0118973328 /NCGR_PEP_ID=MMETSP1173-20130426/9817_1 /TAXON_ID=1034831 /ORGANISM="Rhizochromulina marina cf, Strain CCMP1243" /LENGTH=96 /DNA_ID=CAMNT_0006922961 /DNA_START=98 /DNA_END=388 /DNA_ORIENTATION=+
MTVAPDKAVAFQAKKVDANEGPATIMGLLAMVSGMLAMFLKKQWCAWLCIACTLPHLAQLRRSEMEFRQISGTITFLAASFMFIYMGPTVSEPGTA